MDDLFPILLFLIFVLGPILEGLKRRNKQPPPPPPQRRMPPSGPPQRSRTEEVSTTRAEENASTMVPDDLWEILTGQKRMPAPPTPAPVPAPQAEKKSPRGVVYEPELEEDEEIVEESVVLEDVNVESRRARVEAQSLETIGRHPAPVIVSLEENVPTVAARHAAFHERFVASPVMEPVRPARRRALFDLTNRSELQRAFLLQEVLGKPKGLE